MKDPDITKYKTVKMRKILASFINQTTKENKYNTTQLIT